MEGPINTVVVGYGLAGRVFHAPFIDSVPGLRLAGIVQRHGDEAGTAWPQARVLRSIKAALKDPAVQLVVIATPNQTHFSLVKQALEAGKHVVVDKPFAATGAEARELVDLARTHGLVLAPFHNRRWDGDFLTVRKLLKAGTLGRLITCTLAWDRFRPQPRQGTWKETGDTANGLLMDLGPHLLDQALALFGMPQRLTGSVRKERDGTEIEDAFDIVLHYPRLTVTCRSSLIAAEPSPRFLLHGTQGSFRKFGLDPQEPALAAGAKIPLLGSDDHWLAEPEASWGTLTRAPDPAEPGELIRTQVATERGDYRGFYANVRNAIFGLALLEVQARDAYRVVTLMEKARESSRLGRTLPCEE